MRSTRLVTALTLSTLAASSLLVACGGDDGASGGNSENVSVEEFCTRIEALESAAEPDDIGAAVAAIEGLVDAAPKNVVVGVVAYNPLDENTLLWSPDVDSLPTNTLDPINAIIDPKSSRPNYSLQDLAVGTRYMLVNDYSLDSEIQPYYNWTGIDDSPLTAHKNDIIEFNGQHWEVVFDSANVSNVQYVSNLTTGIQYRWNGSEWSKSYEGYYPAGKWQLII